MTDRPGRTKYYIQNTKKNEKSKVGKKNLSERERNLKRKDEVDKKSWRVSSKHEISLIKRKEYLRKAKKEEYGISKNMARQTK